MDKNFCDIRESWRSQLADMPEEVLDSDEVKTARIAATDYDGFVALGDALSKQLKYRRSATAYSQALEFCPNNSAVLRLRAGRYISSLQCEHAINDFEQCLILGGDELDIRYRLGLCKYFLGQYEQAMEQFELCIPLCDDEMGIAVMYWHTMSAYRCKREACLLHHYHKNMAVGHHTAYEKAISVCSGQHQAEKLFYELGCERNDISGSVAG